MKIAIAQLNPTVGALEENTNRMLQWMQRAEEAGVRLLLFPELAVPGYPPQDLLERPGFVAACLACNQRLVDASSAQLTVVFGTLGTGAEGRLGNEAWVAEAGKLKVRARKQLLPTYDVFDEARHFVAGQSTESFELEGRCFALSICEDSWAEASEVRERYVGSPLKGLKERGVDTLLNLSASPYTSRKSQRRSEIFRQVAVEAEVNVVVANQVGGNDELIFDGASMVWAKGGARLLGQAPSFEEALLIVELDPASGQVGDEQLVTQVMDANCAAQPERLDGIYGALTLGLRDYVRKCGFSKVVLGLSGGIDSALTAVIAVDALGAENVLGIAMPTRYSSKGSVDDAEALARNLGIGCEVLDIDPIFQSYLQSVEPLLDRLGQASPEDVSLENLQARARGATLMAVSNRTGALVLTTGNKSEVAVGYCTLYGDMVGGLAVLSDVPKTLVYELSRHVNLPEVRIPLSSIDKPPSAELRPDQTDQDSLPSYELLDAVVELYVEEHKSPREIVAEGYPVADVSKIIQLLQRSEYKRRQAAPGLIVTRKAFGPGRRVPVASRFRQEVSS